MQVQSIATSDQQPLIGLIPTNFKTLTHNMSATISKQVRFETEEMVKIDQEVDSRLRVFQGVQGVEEESTTATHVDDMFVSEQLEVIKEESVEEQFPPLMSVPLPAMTRSYRCDESDSDILGVGRCDTTIGVTSTLPLPLEVIKEEFVEEIMDEFVDEDAYDSTAEMSSSSRQWIVEYDEEDDMPAFAELWEKAKNDWEASSKKFRGRNLKVSLRKAHYSQEVYRDLKQQAKQIAMD